MSHTRVSSWGEGHGTRGAGRVHGIRYPRPVGEIGCVGELCVGGGGEPEYIGEGIGILRLERLDPVKLVAALAGGKVLESEPERRAT